MTRSMTGFATRAGAHEAWNWNWDIRSVNGRGLDVRLRLPEALPGLDQPVRQAVQARVTRGNVTVVLKLAKAPGQAAGALDTTALGAALAMLAEIEHAAHARGVSIAPASAVEIAGLPGILGQPSQGDDTEALQAAVLADLTKALDDFDTAREAEGAALSTVIAGQIDRIAKLTEQAAEAASLRPEAQAKRLRDNVAKVLDAAEGIDAARIAQELALLAVKSDITEELDRLTAHIAAARSLLGSVEPKGRKLDFLMQEFNREANTLCSKSGDPDLTAIGLDLKSVIDQMREQVQNVE